MGNNWTEFLKKNKGKGLTRSALKKKYEKTKKSIPKVSKKKIRFNLKKNEYLSPTKIIQTIYNNPFKKKKCKSILKK